MTLERTYFEIPSAAGPVVASVLTPPTGSNHPLVILATGDSPSGSDGQTWQQLTPRLLARGMAVLLFDFSGLGHSPGVYRELTLTVGCQNFDAVMEWAQAEGEHDRGRIGIVGSSYGGNVALLRAVDYPSIGAIGLKSASTFLPEGYQLQYGVELMKSWGEDGYSEEVGLNYTAVLDSLFHNTYEAASRISCPVRIVNGTADTAVPIRHARDLLRVMPNASIFEIEGADHWYAESDEWERMATNIIDFLGAHL
ncbi:alpha/beta hydrolase [Streptomyces sp. NPDC056910]|uniref:alpha/beta hydrolase n=1 Tax=Streptomyces sp. NPDC056910 TaxID=3345964 RepID=UPI0036CE1138